MTRRCVPLIVLGLYLLSMASLCVAADTRSVWAAVLGAVLLVACGAAIVRWRVAGQLRRSRVRRLARLAAAAARRHRGTADPAEWFALDHVTTRVRRQVETVRVVLGGPANRVGNVPVPLREIVQAAIAETEGLSRVRSIVPDYLAVAGHTVADMTHLAAELTENAVRHSPEDAEVMIACRPHPRRPGAQLLTVVDQGAGMRASEIAATNRLLARPSDADPAVARRLGFHVVARLAARHRIAVSLTTTPGGGLTAAVVLPPHLFAGGTLPVLAHASGRLPRRSLLVDPLRQRAGSGGRETALQVAPSGGLLGELAGRADAEARRVLAAADGHWFTGSP